MLNLSLISYTSIALTIIEKGNSHGEAPTAACSHSVRECTGSNKFLSCVKFQVNRDASSLYTYAGVGIKSAWLKIPEKKYRVA